MKRINLLPKPKQRELAQEKILFSVAVAVICCTAILLLGVAVQFGVWAYLNNKVGNVANEIEQLKVIANKSENSTVKQQIKIANGQIDDFSMLLKTIPQWSAVLDAFVSRVPDKVKITQFDGISETGAIKITGYAPTRDLVIDLYNNINSDKEHFKDINYPLENVTQPTNVRFFFDITVADKVLVKDAK